jgi:hypothetical protein
MTVDSASIERSRQRHAPALPSSACTDHDCQTATPAALARPSSNVSSVSRPSARPQRCEAPAAGGNSAMTVRSPRISATRRSGGPACASIAAPRPSASSSGRLLAAMHSPQTLRRGKRCFSTSATDRPARASRIAAGAAGGACADDHHVDVEDRMVCSVVHRAVAVTGCLDCLLAAAPIDVRRAGSG